MKLTCSILVLSILAFTASAAFSGDAYQKQSRQTKQSQLWSKISENTKSAEFPSATDMAGGLLFESMDPTMKSVSDQIDAGRTKYIHAVGSVFKAAFKPLAGCPYTGFFEGADSLLIRVSLAKMPEYKNTAPTAAFDNFTPGQGLKYLIDGKPSANLVAMHSVNGVNTFNFFDKDMTTHVPGAEGPALNIVANKFSSATEVVQVVGLKTMAQTKQDGTNVANPKFPWKLIFRAKANVKAMFTEKYTVDFRTTFSKIPSGTVIYDVFAIDDPKVNCEKQIGTITSTSVPTTSLWGDQQLFFQHSDFELDLGVHPEWKDYTPLWKSMFSHDAKKAEGKCPFAM